MKTKYFGIAFTAAALAGIWFGRLAWRAHHNLVTLHARNMPLEQVVRSLERQTWEKIRFDKTLRAKITLNVRDAPLSSVLDLVADRAGARWRKTFAVGASDNALAKLEPVFDGTATLEAAGWTNLAPQFSSSPLPDTPGGGPNPGQGGPGMFRTFRRSGSGGRGGPDAPDGGGQMVTILPDGTVDQWSSERLVMEMSLLPQLGPMPPSEATPQTAALAASAVHGRSRLYYALEKAPFEMGRPPGPPMGGPRVAGRNPGAPGVPGDIAATLAQHRRQQRLRELSRSPEEQVERARQNGENRTHIETGAGAETK